LLKLQLNTVVSVDIITCRTCNRYITHLCGLCSEEDEESDGVASNQSAEDGSVNENTNNCSYNGSIGQCVI